MLTHFSQSRSNNKNQSEKSIKNFILRDVRERERGGGREGGREGVTYYVVRC